MKNLFFVLLVLLSLVTGYFIGKSKKDASEPIKKDNWMAANFTMDSSEIQKLRSVYQTHLDNQNGRMPDTLTTRSISFDRSTFEAIGNFFADTSNNDVKGVRCFIIRYNKEYTKPGGGAKPGKEIVGKITEEQNSIVFLPFDLQNHTLYNRWKSYKKSPLVGYNHGELCPENCYPEE